MGLGLVLSWAGSNDVSGLEEIDKAANEENRGWMPQSRSETSAIIKKSRFSTVIARLDGNPVGYLQSGLRNTSKHIWIENVIVLKKFRKRGISRMMVDKFVHHWKPRIDFIVLITEDKNVKVFEALGFEKEMNYMGYKRARGKGKTQ